MSLFNKILGRFSGGEGAGAAEAAGAAEVEYQGYGIRPACRQEGSQWLTAGVISKRFEEEVKEHHFIRADWHSAKEAAEACAIAKAKRIIDEQGDRIFEER